jgi:acyl-coenzyme A thioesterase PaaI-like protein
MALDLPALHRRLSAWPAGQWLFSRMVCFKAPYFGTIAPRITRLECGLCEGHFADRRAVHNHIGTVHAIALCNIAELVMGLMVDASTPAGMRWIPKGMQVQYLIKAQGRITATARLATPLVVTDTGYEVDVPVELHNPGGELVCRATITCWISPRPR